MVDKEDRAGHSVDPTGKPVIDPTANVYQLVGSTEKRLNDLIDQAKKYDETIRIADNKRADDLREVITGRLNQALDDHKKFTGQCHVNFIESTKDLAHERELRLQQKFESLDRAIQKADLANDKRFDSVNEFRATLADQQRTFIPRNEYEGAHKSLVENVLNMDKNLENLITAQKERIDMLMARKEGGNNMYILVVGLLGILMGIASFIMNLSGKV